MKKGRDEGEEKREGERRRGERRSEEMREWVKLPPAMRVTQRQMRKKTSNRR